MPSTSPPLYGVIRSFFPKAPMANPLHSALTKPGKAAIAKAVENVVRRLRGHYGPSAGLTLASDDEGGTVATLVLPLIDTPGTAEESHVQAVTSRPRRR